MANVKTDSIDYEEVIKRIVDIYNSCYDNEKKIFEKILKEVSRKGYSETLEKIWLMDFVEVPVSIDRFLNDPYYLGETNDNGNMVYPFWRKTLNEIFTEDKNYSEIIFSGATRIGKTSTAISAMAYMLYRLMIYRDPHSFFKKKSISKFTVAFANLTKDLAAGVGFREYNDTLKISPWFNDHGKFTRSEQNFYYIPEGDKIEIIAASDSAHLLGKQLWCLTGDTKIITSKGIYTLESLNGKTISLPQINTDTGDIVECDATVCLTKTTDTLIKITLEDGFSITGTPEHRLMLTDGTYKQMKDIAPDDDIVVPSDGKLFYVYKHTSPSGKVYIGVTSQKNPQNRWGKKGLGYRYNKHFLNAIEKYGWSSFSHEILCMTVSSKLALELEAKFIKEYDSCNPNKGYNKVPNSIQRASEFPNIAEKISLSLQGHEVSETTRRKISQATQGRRYSSEIIQRRVRAFKRNLTPEIRYRMGSSSRGKKLTEEQKKKISERNKGKKLSNITKALIRSKKIKRIEDNGPSIWIHNGSEEKLIYKTKELEYLRKGYLHGRLDNNLIYVTNDVDTLRVRKEDVKSYLDNGYRLGYSVYRSKNITNSVRKYIWFYNDIQFDTSKQLTEYLNEHGYPDIVPSTVTSIVRTGKSVKYPELVSLLSKRCRL